MDAKIISIRWIPVPPSKWQGTNVKIWGMENRSKRSEEPGGRESVPRWVGTPRKGRNAMAEALACFQTWPLPVCLPHSNWCAHAGCQHLGYLPFGRNEQERNCCKVRLSLLCTKHRTQNRGFGTFLEGQWLRLHVPNAKGLQLLLRELRSYMLQWRASLVVQMVKNLPAMHETWVWSRGQKIPWRRKWQPTPVFSPGKSQEQRSLVGHSQLQRVGHDWATSTFFQAASKEPRASVGADDATCCTKPSAAK